MNNPDILDADWRPAGPGSEYEAQAQKASRIIKARRYSANATRKRRTAADRLWIGAITLWVVAVTITLLWG